MRMTSCLVALLLAAGGVWAQEDTMYRWVDKDGRVHYADRPPPADVKALEQRRVTAGGISEAGAPSYVLEQAVKNFPVTLFTAPDCEKECAVAREFLARRGVPHTETVLKSPEDGVLYRETFGTAEVGVPAITVGNDKQRGFESGAWTRMLDAAAYPKSPVPGAAGVKPAPPAGRAAGGE